MDAAAANEIFDEEGFKDETLPIVAQNITNRTAVFNDCSFDGGM
jgi:hypothetical protein